MNVKSVFIHAAHRLNALKPLKRGENTVQYYFIRKW